MNGLWIIVTVVLGILAWAIVHWAGDINDTLSGGIDAIEGYAEEHPLEVFILIVVAVSIAIGFFVL